MMGVTDLQDPMSFYQSILHHIRNVAKKKIVLSALYLGVGDKEQLLIDSLEEALSDSSRPSLSVTVILDHSRAQRGFVNSVSMLSTLLDRFHPRLEVFLYQTPQLRSQFCRYLPLQLKEVFGVYHCKFCLIDDVVILTGANLSDEYFCSRQDRYLQLQRSSINSTDIRVGGNIIDVVSDRSFFSTSSLQRIQSVQLVEYLEAFASIISEDSHRVLPGSKIVPPTSWESASSFPSVPSFFTTTGATVGAAAVASKNEIKEQLQSITKRVTAAAPPQQSARATTGDVMEDSDTYVPFTEPIACKDTKTVMIPLVQHGRLGINQECDSLHGFLSHLFGRISSTCSSLPSLPTNNTGINGPQGISGGSEDNGDGNNNSNNNNNSRGLESASGLLAIATPYSNYRSSFIRAILALTCTWHGYDAEFILPSLPAHGFGSANGIKSYVPALHHYSLHQEIESYFKNSTQHMQHHQQQQQPQPQQRKQEVSSSSSSSTARHGSESTTVGRRSVGCQYYMREGWTFHAKGLWFFPNNATHSMTNRAGAPITLRKTEARIAEPRVYDNQETSVQADAQISNTTGSTSAAASTPINTMPVISYIGSSNFGERSWSRDLELGFLVVTRDPSLQQLFQDEYARIKAFSGIETPINCKVSTGATSPPARWQRGPPPQQQLIVPRHYLPQYSPLQKWMITTVAKIIRTFL